jgi:hypothetical protein
MAGRASCSNCLTAAGPHQPGSDELMLVLATGLCYCLPVAKTGQVEAPGHLSRLPRFSSIQAHPRSGT